MLAKCYSGALSGVDARTVEIEVYSALGTSQFAIVGLPDQAVREAKDRIPTALKNSGLSSGREFDVTVNLAPADVRKEGPVYDLAIAVCLLKATGRLRTESLADYAFAGELALSGEVRRVHGILPIVMEMRRIGRKSVIVPYDNAMEASVVKGIDFIAVRTLQEAVQYLNGERIIEPRYTDLSLLVSSERDCLDDFADVKGQGAAKKALEIAVAGGHNVLMIGSPGSGKTMLARRMPTIMPPMTLDEAVEATKIHSVAGKLGENIGLMTKRPFRAPHHLTSQVALIGGGQSPQPGEVSLAHNGVLFLDELPEFGRNVLEVLRQPLEDRMITISRAKYSVEYPSNFTLIGAMNPCPCGYYNHPTKECTCQPFAINRYFSRISGPLLDRIDMHIEVVPVSLSEINGDKVEESSADIRKRVIAAREIQSRRFAGMGIHSNAMMNSAMLRHLCPLSNEVRALLESAMSRLNLSARAYDRIIKVARTIADLAGAENIEAMHIAEAINYRTLDRDSWGR